MPKNSLDAYRDDLAYIHDAGFTRFAAQAGPWLVETLQKRGIVGGRIVELGCGSGVLAETLAGSGYDVTGFDISGAMIDRARRRVPQGDFRQASFLDADLPPCSAVMALGEVFNYLFDGRNTQATLRRLFRRIHKALLPQGLFVFDIAEPGRAGKGGHTRGYAEGPDWACLFAAEEDRVRKTLMRTITTFRQAGECYRRDHEVHRLRLLDRAQVLAQVREAGFRARVLRSYGAWRFPPGWVGIVTGKK